MLSSVEHENLIAESVKNIFRDSLLCNIKMIFFECLRGKNKIKLYTIRAVA